SHAREGQHHGGGPGAPAPGGSSQKKSLRAAEQDRPDVVMKRREWLERIADVDPSRFVFYDESGAKTNMTRLYGRTLDGGRLVDAVPQGHWCTTSMLSSFRFDGSTAAMTLPGATDRLAFDAYVEQVLVP